MPAYTCWQHETGQVGEQLKGLALEFLAPNDEDASLLFAQRAYKARAFTSIEVAVQRAGDRRPVIKVVHAL